MFGPHLLTSEIQFGVCDELDAHSVTASASEKQHMYRQTENTRNSGITVIKTLYIIKRSNITFYFSAKSAFLSEDIKLKKHLLKYQQEINYNYYYF